MRASAWTLRARNSAINALERNSSVGVALRFCIFRTELMYVPIESLYVLAAASAAPRGGVGFPWISERSEGGQRSVGRIVRGGHIPAIRTWRR